MSATDEHAEAVPNPGTQRNRSRNGDLPAKADMCHRQPGQVRWEATIQGARATTQAWGAGSKVASATRAAGMPACRNRMACRVMAATSSRREPSADQGRSVPGSCRLKTRAGATVVRGDQVQGQLPLGSRRQGALRVGQGAELMAVTAQGIGAMLGTGESARDMDRSP